MAIVPKGAPVCASCRYFNDFGMLCVRGKREVGIDPVSGHAEHRYSTLRYASTERAWSPLALVGLMCGPRGRHFTPINPTPTEAADRE